MVVAVDRVLGRPGRRLLEVGRGQEVDEPAQLGHGLDVVLEGEVGDTGLAGVGHGTAQLLLGHDLVGDRANHLRPGHEHVGAVLDHEDEVGHRRRIDRTARAGAADHADLRDHAGRLDVAHEHLGVAGERIHALLDARPAGIVEADDGRADLHRAVHHLGDLGGVTLRERAAEHGEILAEDEDQPAVDGTLAGDDTIARHPLVGHAELGAAMLDEHVAFLERVLVEQQIDPLARRQLAAGMLSPDAPLATTLPCALALGLKLVENILHQPAPPPWPSGRSTIERPCGTATCRARVFETKSLAFCAAARQCNAAIRRLPARSQADFAMRRGPKGSAAAIEMRRASGRQARSRVFWKRIFGKSSWMRPRSQLLRARKTGWPSRSSARLARFACSNRSSSASSSATHQRAVT